jgi:hypothetical protein
VSIEGVSTISGGGGAARSRLYLPGGGSFLDVLKAWINLGCPLPAPKPAAASWP